MSLFMMIKFKCMISMIMSTGTLTECYISSFVKTLVFPSFLEGHNVTIMIKEEHVSVWKIIITCVWGIHHADMLWRDAESCLCRSSLCTDCCGMVRAEDGEATGWLDPPAQMVARGGITHALIILQTPGEAKRRPTGQQGAQQPIHAAW